MARVVIGGAQTHYEHFEHVIRGMLATTRQSQLQQLVCDVRASVALPPLSEELPPAWQKRVRQCHELYSALYVVSVCLQAAAAALGAPVSSVHRRNILAVLLEPVTALHHQIIDAGLPAPARRRWLAVLYQYARLWGTKETINNAVLDFFCLALPALTVALCPVLAAPRTRGRDAFLLQGAEGPRVAGLAAFPLPPQREPHFYLGGDHRPTEVRSYSLRLLRDKGSGQLYLPLTVAPATFYRRRGRYSDNSPVNFLADALWRWSQLDCLEEGRGAVQESVRLLARQEGPAAKDGGWRVGGPREEAELIAAAVGDDATTCYARLYADELGFRLCGGYGNVRGALPGKWRTGVPGTTYLQRELSLFCAYPVQAVRSAAEKLRAREQSPGACNCRAGECKRWLARALHERRGVEISLLSAPAYWKELEAVGYGSAGGAQLFALGRRVPGAAAPPPEAASAAAGGLDDDDEGA